MGKYSQANQPLSVATPLGTDALLLEKFTGTETISGLFRYELDLLAESTTTIAFDQILGQSITVTLLLPDATPRYFNGIVSRFAQCHQIPGPEGENTFTRYQAEMVPQLWLLTRKAQSRIFQQIAVPDILTQVLSGINVSNQIQGTFDPRDYCVQYRETDFAFISRLMEEEGIFYFFNHANGSHQLVLANTPQSHPDLPGPTTLIFELVLGGTRPEARVSSWEKVQEVRSGKSTLWDHCFELPTNNLQAVQTTPDSVQAGTVTHSLQVGGNDQLELYDFPGGYAQRYDGVAPGGGDRASDIQKIFQDNTRTVGIRMQQETEPALSITGSSNCRHCVAGHKFTLDRHFNANGPYVLTRVELVADLGDTYTGGSVAAFSYHNEFQCIPFALPYRPARTTPKARVDGTQTAVVVGPAGQEIFTDKYGRVKVQFFWDRQGTNDGNSSCWIRVATLWAGKQWGMIHIPRIGQEVIVDFLEGDPDQPIIVGSVYNADNMPPWTLPDNMTQSGIISRSTLQGIAENYNQIQFEDKKGSEQINVHAERDYNRVVENNDALTVGSDNSQTCPDGSQTISIYKNRTETVETGDETVTIKQGNRTINVNTGNDTHNVKQGNREVNVDQGTDTINVKTGDRTLNVKTGNRVVNVDTGNDTHNVKTGNREVNVNTGDDTHNIKMGNRSVKIDMGSDSLTISMGNQTTKLDLGASSTEAMQSITLKVGANSIMIDQTGITLQGIMIKLQGQGMLQVQAPMIQVSADAMLMLKGAITMIN